MAEPIVWPNSDGQEVQIVDLQNLGAVAGLADDRLLAEFLRLGVFDGSNVYKAILPYEQGKNLSQPWAGSTVVPSGSANGSVVINPFRAVVGSRNAANAAPSPNPAAFTSDALANWRDVRSGVFVGGSTSLSATQAFAANATYSPRWDLVYASLAVDANGPSVSRRVKNPSSNTISTVSVPEYLTNSVSIGVVAGTASGALPAIPTDAGGVYNIPLAFVRIPNGFTAGSTISAKDIRAYSSSFARYRNLGSGARMRPASGCNDLNVNTQATSVFPWSASTGQRPGYFLPPDWVGGEIIVAAIDCSNANPNNWSHPVGSIVDASIDWRNRLVTSFVFIGSSAGLWNDPIAGSQAIPLGFTGGNGAVTVGMGNTGKLDANLVAGDATVFWANHAINGSVASGAQLGFYCDNAGAASTGGLLFFASTGTVPACYVYAVFLVSPPFPNY